MGLWDKLFPGPCVCSYSIKAWHNLLHKNVYNDQVPIRPRLTEQGFLLVDWCGGFGYTCTANWRQFRVCGLKSLLNAVYVQNKNTFQQYPDSKTFLMLVSKWVSQRNRKCMQHKRDQYTEIESRQNWKMRGNVQMHLQLKVWRKSQSFFCK